MMRIFQICSAVALSLLLAPICGATSNLNLSKSNINRIVYSANIVTAAQAAAVLAELDRLAPRVIDDATVRRVLQQQGVAADKLKVIKVVSGATEVGGVADPAKAQRKSMSVIYCLEHSEDEAQARQIAVSDSGVQVTPPVMIPIHKK